MSAKRPELRDFDLDRELVKAEMRRSMFGSEPQKVRCGRFHIVRVLGRGGFGVVYEALDPEHGRRVAIKVLTRMDARAIYRLKNEFRSLSAMDHPGLVRLDALFYQDDQWFFSMERVDGQPFSTFVREEGGEPLVRLRHALRQLADAVSAIHAAGKLHRDLKPSNVLVTRAGRVVVLDFGLVFDEQLGGGSTITQDEVLGTPAYMAPELARGQSATRASDWYAVGVMLYEALTGALPFDGSPLRVLSDKLAHDAPDPRGLVPDAPADLADACVQLLARDPGQRADGEVLLRALGTPTAAAADDPTRAAGPAPFIGRARELRVLGEALSAVERGAAAGVLLHGPSGVGKSSLLEEFCTRCAERALVLRGRCNPQEALPYKVFDGVVDVLSRHLRRLSDEDARGLLPRHVGALLQLFPALGHVPCVERAAAAQVRPSDARELRNQGFAALKELLLRLTDRGPVVIAVDDLQWGDVDSARLLRNVLNPPDAPPLLFIASYRSDEVDSSALLRALRAADGGGLRWSPIDLPLAPLSADEGSTLAQLLLGHGDGAGGAEADALGASIAAEASGFPFFIAELVRHVGARAGGAITSGHVSLERLILDRLVVLSPAAQRLMRVVSVAKSPLEVAIATEAAGLERGDSAEVLRLRNAHLLRVRKGSTGAELVEAYHDRIHEAIAASIPQAERRALHRTLASLLEQHGLAEPERLVLHYSAAGDRVRAGQTAVRAGQLASEKLAFDRAAEMFERALALLPLPGVTPHALHRQLGDALAVAGRGMAAGDAYRRAAALAPDDESVVLEGLASVQYLGTSATEHGMELTRDVLRRLNIKLPASAPGAMRAYTVQRTLLAARENRLLPRSVRTNPRMRLAVLRDLGPTISWVNGVAGAVVHTHYLREAIDADEPDYMLNALCVEVGHLVFQGGPRYERAAARRLQQLNELAQRVDTRYARAAVALAEANRALWCGRGYADTLAHAARARALLQSERAALPWERMMLAMIEILALTFTGDLARLNALLLENKPDVREDQFVPMMLVASAAGFDILRGDPNASIAQLEEMRDATNVSINFRYTWLLRMGEALSYAGRSTEALQLMNSAWDMVNASYLRYSEYVFYNTLYYRGRTALAAYFETGDPRAAKIARRAAAVLPDAPGTHGACRAGMMASILDADGDHARAIDQIRLSRDRMIGCQAAFSVLNLERWLHERLGDIEGVRRVDAELERRGVVNPERWVWVNMPMRSRGSSR